MLHLEEFNDYASKVGNRYEAINRLCKKSRKIGKKYPKQFLDSKQLSYAVSNKLPEIKKTKISFDEIDDILWYVNDSDVIDSVKRSIECSSKESINYVYLDSLDDYKQCRVRFLVNQIISTLY